MRNLLVGIAALAVGSFSGASALAEDLEILDPAMSAQIAQFLIEGPNGIENPQVKVEGDVDNACGVHREMIGLILVPAKDLSPDNIPEEVNSETGAGLAYLFMSTGFAPVIDGEPLDAAKMRSMEIVGQDGNQQKVSYLTLAARHTDDDVWHLYGYGTDEKPVLDVQIGEGSGPGTQPLALEVRDVGEDNQGVCYVTIYDLYQTSFPIKYTAPEEGDKDGAEAK